MLIAPLAICAYLGWYLTDFLATGQMESASSSLLLAPTTAINLRLTCTAPVRHVPPRVHCVRLCHDAPPPRACRVDATTPRQAPRRRSGCACLRRARPRSRWRPPTTQTLLRRRWSTTVRAASWARRRARAVRACDARTGDGAQRRRRRARSSRSTSRPLTPRRTGRPCMLARTTSRRCSTRARCSPWCVLRGSGAALVLFIWGVCLCAARGGAG